MKNNNLYELTKMNKEYFEKIKREKILESIFCLILIFLVSTGLKGTEFKYPIIFLIIILMILIGINISRIIKIEQKDNMLTDFFYKDYLLTLEKLINMNNYMYFTFAESKNELVNILVELSRKFEILKLKAENTINLETELNRYRITYEIIPNGRKVENLFRIKRFWQSDIVKNTEKELYLSIINNLYRGRREDYKSFKIIEIEEVY